VKISLKNKRVLLSQEEIGAHDHSTQKPDCVPAPLDYDLNDPKDQEEAADQISREQKVDKKTAWEIIKSLARLGWQNRRLVGSVLSLLFERHEKELKSIPISEKEFQNILKEEFAKCC